MIIQFDSEVLTQMAALSGKAADFIATASAHMNRVTDHDDWHCRERDQIVEQLEIIKKKQQVINEYFDIFASQLNQAAERFSSTTSMLLAEMRGADSCTADYLAIPAGESEHGVSLDMAAQVAEFSKGYQTESKLQNYVVGNLDVPIRVCDFSSFRTENGMSAEEVYRHMNSMA